MRNMRPVKEERLQNPPDLKEEKGHELLSCEDAYLAKTCCI